MQTKREAALSGWLYDAAMRGALRCVTFARSTHLGHGGAIGGGCAVEGEWRVERGRAAAEREARRGERSRLQPPSLRSLVPSLAHTTLFISPTRNTAKE